MTVEYKMFSTIFLYCMLDKDYAIQLIFINYI